MRGLRIGTFLSVELTALRYFKAIAAEGHMTRAAERLGITQPALSATVRRLEEEAGAALLDRTGRGVRLTEAGRIFLEHAEAAIASADRALSSVRSLIGLEHGDVSIGGGATAIGCILPPIVREFREAHSSIRVRLREAGSAGVAEGVLAGAQDIGFVTMPITAPGWRDLMVIAEVLDELVLIVPSDADGGASRRTFRWADLEGQPVVGFEAGSAIRRAVDEAALAGGVVLNTVMELRSIEGIRRMVAAGVGVGFISRFAVGIDSDPTHLGVRALRCKDQRLTRRLAMVRRRDRVPSAAVSAFERVAVRAFKGLKGS